jgi:Tol biopolymer transport system component
MKVLARIALTAAMAAILNSSLPAAQAAPAIVNDTWPHFSPDGSRIAFDSNRGGQRAPYIMQSDGSAVTSVPVVTREGQKFGSVAWLSDSTLLYSLYEPIRLGAVDDGGEIDAFMSATTSGLEPEMLYTGINVQRPAASPSRDALVFEAEHGAFQSQPNIDIETVELATLTVHVLTHDDGEYIQAAWSPDGAKIAYACATGKQTLQICTMKTDGTDVRVLTSESGSHQWPAWSPDSKRIAYFDEKQVNGKTDSTIGVVNADGGNEHAITAHSGVVRDETPAWSPDGASIAFQTDRMGAGFRIAVIHPDGSGLQVLTK